MPTQRSGMPPHRTSFPPRAAPAPRLPRLPGSPSRPNLLLTLDAWQGQRPRSPSGLADAGMPTASPPGASPSLCPCRQLIHSGTIQICKHVSKIVGRLRNYSLPISSLNKISLHPIRSAYGGWRNVTHFVYKSACDCPTTRPNLCSNSVSNSGVKR